MPTAKSFSILGLSDDGLKASDTTPPAGPTPAEPSPKPRKRPDHELRPLDDDEWDDLMRRMGKRLRSLRRLAERTVITIMSLAIAVHAIHDSWKFALSVFG